MVDVVSVHIGKTAGSTFRSILLDIYGSQEILEIYDKETKKLYKSKESIPAEVKVIQGHFSTKLFRKSFPDAKWIVWLRHPIFRLISQYFYTKTINDSKLTENMSLLEFAELPKVKNRLSAYIGEMQLSDFFFVGIQEFFSEDLIELKEIMGWSQFKINTENSNRHPKYQESLKKIFGDRQLLNQLSLLNSKDLDLYHAALELRAQRRNESKWLQYMAADWNRNKFLLQQSTLREKEIRRC